MGTFLPRPAALPEGGEGTQQIGGGGEGMFKNGAGIGAELAYLTPFESIGSGIGAFSINGSYHFLKSSRSEKVVPFVTGVPLIAIAGIFTYSVDANYNGLFSGTDTINLMGQYLPRFDQGTYKMESNYRGTGFYTDSLGNKVNYVFTAVGDGDTLYFQGTDPGVAVSGTAWRIR